MAKESLEILSNKTIDQREEILLLQTENAILRLRLKRLEKFCEKYNFVKPVRRFYDQS